MWMCCSPTIVTSIAMLYGATISILTLFVARDVPFASVSRAAVVQAAYARPPHTSFRSPRNKCNCTSGMQPSYILSGGGTVGDDISQRRHSTSSLSMTQSDSSGGEVVVVVKNNAKYHLIWSAGFWKKMTISTILLLILQSALKRSMSDALEHISLPLHACHGRIFPSVILPLLSSSCCAIQLIINALSGWGCAGFNSYLGKLNFVGIVIVLLWV